MRLCYESKCLLVSKCESHFPVAKVINFIENFFWLLENIDTIQNSSEHLITILGKMTMPDVNDKDQVETDNTTMLKL